MTEPVERAGQVVVKALRRVKSHVAAQVLDAECVEAIARALPIAEALVEVVRAAENWSRGGAGTVWFEHGMDLSMSRIVHGDSPCNCVSPDVELRAALAHLEEAQGSPE